MASGSVSQYLSQVEENTKKYLEYFKSRGLPEPSYDEGDGLDPQQPPPSDIIACRDAAVEAADELHHLLLGPLGLLLSSPGDVSFSCISFVPMTDAYSNISCSVCSTSTGTKSLIMYLRSK